MKTILPLEGEGNWYKGNLHCHSTMSDGKLEPSQLVKMYRERGYSFLAFSEHELFTNWVEFNAKDFMIMPAIEREAYGDNFRICYHIHGIQGSERLIKHSKNKPLQHGDRGKLPEWQGTETVQGIIDELRDAGNLVMFNHPVWSFNELEDFIDLEGYFALEIFNYGCEVENRTGLSTVYWDSLLKRGKKVWGIATDDNHNKNRFGEAPIDWDSFGGWINVKAEELAQNAIAEALSQGRFYSSSGPEIYNYGVRDGEVFIQCSEVERVYFLTGDRSGYSRRDKERNPITEASYKLNGREKYVRIECVDKFGKTAWTNPIFLGE